MFQSNATIVQQYAALHPESLLVDFGMPPLDPLDRQDWYAEVARFLHHLEARGYRFHPLFLSDLVAGLSPVYEVNLDRSTIQEFAQIVKSFCYPGQSVLEKGQILEIHVLGDGEALDAIMSQERTLPPIYEDFVVIPRARQLREHCFACVDACFQLEVTAIDPQRQARIKSRLVALRQILLDEQVVAGQHEAILEKSSEHPGWYDPTMLSEYVAGQWLQCLELPILTVQQARHIAKELNHASKEITISLPNGQPIAEYYVFDEQQMPAPLIRFGLLQYWMIRTNDLLARASADVCLLIF